MCNKIDFEHVRHDHSGEGIYAFNETSPLEGGYQDEISIRHSCAICNKVFLFSIEVPNRGQHADPVKGMCYVIRDENGCLGGSHSFEQDENEGFPR